MGCIKNTLKISIIIVLVIVLIGSVLYFVFPEVIFEPEITMIGSESTTVEYGKKYSDQGVIACIGGKDITNKVKVHNEINYNYKDKYQIRYELKIRGKIYQKTRIVEIVDNEPPEIILNGNKEINLNSINEYVEPGYLARDNYDGDISEKVVITQEQNGNKYIIKYSVSDSSFNKTVKERVINVKNNKMIYLTFDDGPSWNITPQVLDILKKNNIKATFFIINYDKTTEPLVKRMYDEGHTVGIHGYSHNYGEIYCSTEAFVNNIEKLKKKIIDSIGYEPFVIRFPGGSSNTVSRKYCKGIMTELVKMVEENGYHYTDWNSCANDAVPGGATKETIYYSVIKDLSPYKNNIILMHDSGNRQTTADALQMIIDYGKENGYTFSQITEITELIHHKINN